MHFTSALWFSALIPTIFSSSIGFHAGYSSSDVTTASIGKLPNGAWAENLAIDPFGSHKTKPLEQLPVAGGLLGITKIQYDVFAVVAGNLSLPCSFSVWKVDVNSSPANSTKIADIPPAVALNGATTLNDNSSSILVADSGAGVVYPIDTYPGKYTVVLDDPTMKIAANSTIPFGITGVHTKGHYLYYTSFTQILFARIPIHPDRTAAGPAEIIACNGLKDDFTFDRAGNAYVATNVDNTAQEMTTTLTLRHLSFN